MRISMIDNGFCRSITHKYHHFRNPRLKFPALIFLFSSRCSILHYLLLKNMNILPGNRNYHPHFHQHHHVNFAINLFLRMSHQFSAAPAATAPTVARPTNKFNPTVLTFPGRNDIYRELNQTTQSIRSIFPTQKTAKEQRSIFTHILQAKSFFLSQRIWKNLETSNTDMFENPTERLFRVAGFYHPELPTLRGITTFAGDTPASAASPGGTGVNITHNHFYRESKPTVEKRQPAADQLLSGTDHTYRIFLKNSRFSNMFFHDNQRLIRKIHSPIETRTSYPTLITLKNAVVFSQYPQTKVAGFYHPELPILRGITTFAGDTPASAASPGGTGGESAVYHHSHTTNRSSQYSSASEFVLPVSKFFPGRWGTVVSKRLLSPLIHYNQIFPGDKEDINGKRMTLFSKSSTDLHYFNPLKRVGSDLEKSITINDMSRVNDTSGVRGININSSSLDSTRNVEMERVKPMVDIGQLTDQVYRMLEKKIKTERDRRGW